jgi:hypothetical protein
MTYQKTGTSFIDNTLQDVISLQKIEDGHMELDMKLFAPELLFKKAMTTFK